VAVDADEALGTREGWPLADAGKPAGHADLVDRDFAVIRGSPTLWNIRLSRKVS
jgi:hypothetical protein